MSRIKALAQNDLRAFNISGFSKPYSAEKKQELQSLGWKVKEDKSGSYLKENYVRISEGTYERVTVDYLPPRQEMLHAMPAEPKQVLYGYAPAQNVAAFLPYNYPIQNTALWAPAQEHFSYCESPQPKKGKMTNYGISCQTVNREVCDNAMKQKQLDIAKKTVLIFHNAYAVTQLNQLNYKGAIPDNDIAPSPKLVQACDNFYAAYGQTARQLTAYPASQTQKVPMREINSMGSSQQRR